MEGQFEDSQKRGDISSGWETRTVADPKCDKTCKGSVLEDTTA